MSIEESSNKPIRLVLQRFRQATLLVDEKETITCGNNYDKSCLVDPLNSGGGGGMLCYVSFTKFATIESVWQAAKTVMNMPMMTKGAWGDGSDVMSVLEMASQSQEKDEACDVRRGVAVMIVPQANLICKVKSQGRSIQYHGQISKDNGKELYALFVEYCKAMALEQQCTNRGDTAPSWLTEILKGPQKKTVDISVEPSLIFRLSCEYSEWDDVTGLPLTLSSGEPLTKSAIKKLKKQQDSHKKKHEKYIATLAETHKATIAAATPTETEQNWSILDNEFI